MEKRNVILKRNIISESGLRGMKELAKRYPKAKIYFHQDLDGVTTALGMKNYLEQNGIEVVDAEVIQYGAREFAVKKLDAEGDVMPVLVDFAHGKPMFVIHTDHHDTQAGVEAGTATNFRPSRSNVETISKVVSPKEIFPADDVELITMVDSADYLKYNVTPEQVMNYIFKLDKDKDLQTNKRALGLMVNKILLAYKNKPKFMEEVVMGSQPSLLSILNTIKRIVGEKGYAGVDDLVKNQDTYIKGMENFPKRTYEDGIITQYSAGFTGRLGSYDRFVPYKLYPDADFLVLGWPMGMVQASCNPFKEGRALKGVNLGEIKDEVLSKWEPQLKDRKVKLSTVKWVSESDPSFGEGSAGFTYKDLLAIYGNEFQKMVDGEDVLKDVKEALDEPFDTLTEEQKELLDSITISVWDIIQANSGGHKCITNISGLNYIARSSRPSQGKYKSREHEQDDSPSVKFIKMIMNEFTKILKEKVKAEKGQ
jgi:hypothetical protein